MRHFLLAAALLALPAAAPESRGGWPRGGCAPVGAPAFFPAAPEWEWRLSADGSRADLYHFGQYHHTHFYPPEEKQPDPVVPAEAAKPKKPACDCCPTCGCGDACRCRDGKPCCDGCKCIVKGEALPRWMTHGTEPEKIAPSEEYRVGGKVVSRDEAVKALRDAQLTDDSRKPRLTVIGSPDERKEALAALPADLKEHWLVKEYEPDHWAVKGAGFKTDGHPTVYLQAPDGKVLHRQDDANNVTGAVRKADPTYDPAKDPDLRKPRAPDRPAAPDDGQHPLTGWVVAGFVGLAALLWKGPKQ
jgi:hypothetical protein